MMVFEISEKVISTNDIKEARKDQTQTKILRSTEHWFFPAKPIGIQNLDF